MTNRVKTVMLSAGEASGDQHAANLFLELKKRLPEVRGFGMGGARMRDAGIDIHCDSSDFGVIGPIDVLKHFREIRRALSSMKELACREKPDLLICVDYKEFNFKLARHAKRCGVKVLFYVSPQVWAWRPGRVKKYGEAINAMAVIFPFETPYYERHDIPVHYVGHPSVDKVHPRFSPEKDRERFGIDLSRPVVGLLPGSRSNEIRRLLPVMLQAASRVAEEIPGAQFFLPQAGSVRDEWLKDFLDRTALDIRVVKNEPYDVIQCCDAVLTASGTATLEVALLGIPMAIVYKLSALTYWLARLLVRIPFIGLPNIVAGRLIVKEFIQHEARPERLSDEIVRILTDENYARRMREDLNRVREELGEGGGSANMAELAMKMLAE
ncbi:MAG: lipid-A-disaccharide synthase [Gammaproteobacteria bacterium]